METADEITTQVKEILATKLGVQISALNGNTSFTDDLGADSLDVMETFMDIEKHFNIKISDEEAEKTKNGGLFPGLYQETIELSTYNYNKGCCFISLQ